MRFSEVLPLRRIRRSQEGSVICLLGAATFVIAVAICLVPRNLPMMTLLLPLVAASWLISPKRLPAFVVYVMALLLVTVCFQDWPLRRTQQVSVGEDFLLAAIILGFSWRRRRLGVDGMRGTSMFLDLRDRILGSGGMPTLPGTWYAERALVEAGGTRFAGDFVVAAQPSPDRLEVALVDVSGKGEQAGTRALQLCSALGGLLGAVPAADFLDAANCYLLRQGWDEEFATAIHVSIDLVSGDFETRSAGHPPAIVRDAGSACWRQLHGDGLVLGISGEQTYEPVSGTLRDGEALLLYTDGMVEEPGIDIDSGIQRLMRAAEEEISARGVAGRLVERFGARDDDRCVVVVGRGPVGRS